jgi:hypothetical protein
LTSDAAARLRATARVVGQGLVLLVAIDLAGTLLHERPLAALVVQVAIAEFGAGKLAIAWSAPDSVAPTAGAITRRAAIGAAFGLGAGVLLMVAGALAGTLSIKLTLPHDPVPAAFGLLVAALTAARDELLLRGLVIRVLAGWSRGAPVVAACALAAGARVWFLEDTTPQSAIVAAVAGAALACVWLVDRGAWMAVGANAAWMFFGGTLSHGVLVDVRGGDGPWGGGVLGVAGGRTSALAMGLIAVVAVVWWRRARVRE